MKKIVLAYFILFFSIFFITTIVKAEEFSSREFLEERFSVDAVSGAHDKDLRLFKEPLFNSIKVVAKKINIEGFPKAFNPSIIKKGDNFLLSFRCTPEPLELWISYIGIVLLDSSFKPISQPILLNTRVGDSVTPSQSEDARLFCYKGEIYLIYNDNIDVTNPTINERRDMFITRIDIEDDHFTVGPITKLMHEENYQKTNWQKNWVPFEWNGELMLGYSITPHEVLCSNLENGVSTSCYKTETPFQWGWGGPLRGGTPALLVDGEYLAFFHSAINTRTIFSGGNRMWHYFMGAYTFTADPPFSITKITPTPITTREFYAASSYEKKVVFPGGFVITDTHFHIAYGKDDSEVWIATVERNQLQKVLRPLSFIK